MAYSVFISHAYDHRDIYYELVQKLNDANHFSWHNRSLGFDIQFDGGRDDVDNEELRNALSERIATSDVLIALTKPVASRRRWLQWEIQHARQLGKPVIGVARRLNDNVSSYVRDHSDHIVSTWKTQEIVTAIKLYAHQSRDVRRVPSIETTASALPPEVPDIEIVQPQDTGAASPVVVEVSQLASMNPAPGEQPHDILFKGETANPKVTDHGPTRERSGGRWWWPFAS